MFCSFCGKQNEDGVNFCAGCGKPVNTPAPEIQNEQAPILVNPGIMTIKQIASSPLFLAGVIAFTIYTLFSILGNGYNVTQFLRTIYMMDYEMGIEIPYWLYDSFFGHDSGGIISSIMGQIPDIVVATGLWVFYFSASSKRTPFIKTGGLTAINVIQWIKLIGFGITTLLFALIFAILFIDDFLYSGISIGLVFIAGLSIVMLLILPFIILYYAKVISSVRGIKKAVQTGEIKKLPSVYVGIILVISSVITLFLTVTSVIIPVISYGFVSSGIIYGFGNIALSATYILFAALIFKARKILKSL